MRDLIFDLLISSTVSEETTWSDYGQIIVNYYNPSVPSRCTVQSAPTSHDAITDYTMRM